MNKYLIPTLVIILFLSSSFIVASSPKDKSTIDDDWKYDFPSGFSDNLDYSKMTRFVDRYEKEYLWDDYISKETMISEHPAIMFDSYMNLHMWPMQGYNRQHIGRSPYNTEDNPGIEKWRFPVGDWCEGSPVIELDGTIYFGGGVGDPYLYAIFPNGTLKWKFEAERGLGDFGSSPAIADDGTIYIGTIFGSYIQAVNPDGTGKWKYWVPEIDTSITIGNDGVIYYGHHQGVDARYPNGTLKWRFSTGDFVQSTPAIDEEGTIFFGSHDNYIYAVYPNGTMKWRFETGGWVHGSPTISPDGIVYCGSDDHYLYALYPNNGTFMWKTSIVGSMRSSPSLDKDGNLYFGTTGGRIICMRPNGTEKWHFSLEYSDQIWGSTSAISDDGTIYIGVNIGFSSLGGGEIIALNLDGTLKWRKILSDSLCMSAPVIGENGDVYICSSYSGTYGIWGHLHAFGAVDSNVPPETPSINGPVEGQIHEWQHYYISTVDLDLNPVAYFVDWGDGTNLGWSSDFGSGEYIIRGHIWDRRGDFTIKVKARDTFGAESEWGTLEVTMPVNQQSTPSLFLRFLERFPNAFPILRHLIGL